MSVRTRTLAAIVFVAFLGGAGARAAAPTPKPAPARLVAVGDLHGDLHDALAVLRLAKLIDDEGHWSGGSATLVQTGDVVDRGPDSKGVLDLIRRLKDEASAAGGRVVPLLGNHEVMNMTGDWRYVSRADVAGFGGVKARIAAFALDGAYGGWLSERDAVAKVGDAVFVHGGITPKWAARGIDGINAAVRAALHGGPPTVLGEDGPLWYRGFVVEPAQTACASLQRSLEALGASRMIVGHTAQRNGRVLVRCGGRLDVIDVGISSVYGGHLAALQIVGHDARALYPDGTVDVEDPPR